MPNWSYNSMKITGAAEEIVRFKQTCIIDGQFDFNALIPMPQEVHYSPGELIDGIVFPAWFVWAAENWGTKWNATHFCLEKDEANCLECSFATAWSPPVPVWEKMAEMFPALEVKLSGIVQEMDFACHGTILGGKLKMHELADDEE
jgi:Ferredoxin-like domain in Api92-like protein